MLLNSKVSAIVLIRLSSLLLVSPSDGEDDFNKKPLQCRNTQGPLPPDSPAAPDARYWNASAAGRPVKRFVGRKRSPRQRAKHGDGYKRGLHRADPFKLVERPAAIGHPT
jgi:hypothetical protein